MIGVKPLNLGLGGDHCWSLVSPHVWLWAFKRRQGSTHQLRAPNQDMPKFQFTPWNCWCRVGSRIARESLPRMGPLGFHGCETKSLIILCSVKRLLRYWISANSVSTFKMLSKFSRKEPAKFPAFPLLLVVVCSPSTGLVYRSCQISRWFVLVLPVHWDALLGKSLARHWQIGTRVPTNAV